jgi:hypothetical protein
MKSKLETLKNVVSTKPRSPTFPCMTAPFTCRKPASHLPESPQGLPGARLTPAHDRPAACLAPAASCLEPAATCQVPARRG